MNHKQIEKQEMCKKMNIFFTTPANSSIWTGFTRLINEIANFVTLNQKLATYAQQHQQDIKGVTQAKNNAFAAMVLLVVNKAHKAYVWAVDTANDDMIEVFDVQKSSFHNIPEDVAFTRIKNLRDALNTNIGAMASVQLTAADVTAVNTAITTYQNTLGVAGAEKSHKTEGTQEVENLILALDKSLDLIDHLMVSSYSDAHAAMVKEYLINRNIDKLATRHSGVHASIFDAATGKALQGAVLNFGGKSTTSDINGLAEIIKVKNGTYNMTVTLEGYAPQNIKVDIIRGKIQEMEIKLTK